MTISNDRLLQDVAMHQARRIGRAVQLMQGCAPTETELSFWAVLGRPDNVYHQSQIADAARILSQILTD